MSFLKSILVGLIKDLLASLVGWAKKKWTQKKRDKETDKETSEVEKIVSERAKVMKWPDGVKKEEELARLKKALREALSRQHSGFIPK